jgi:hypothetical protein
MSGGDGGRIQYSSAYCQVHVVVCGYVQSCLALNGIASRGPDSSGTYPVLKEPSDKTDGGPGLCQAGL